MSLPVASDPKLDFATQAWLTNLERIGMSVAIGLVVAAIAYLAFRLASRPGPASDAIDEPVAGVAPAPNKSPRAKVAETLTVLFSVALIGALVGDISGASPQSIAGQLVPALLTLIGAFAVYLFGKERDEAGLVNLAVLAFIVSLSVTYANGQIMRNDREALLFCRDKYSNVDLLRAPEAWNQFNSQFGVQCDDLFRRYTR